VDGDCALIAPPKGGAIHPHFQNVRLSDSLSVKTQDALTLFYYVNAPFIIARNKQNLASGNAEAPYQLKRISLLVSDECVH
jgi:hypothetical protein